MNLAGRMLLLIIIVDTFLFFGMSATNQIEQEGFGHTMGVFVEMNGDLNSTYAPNNLISMNNTGLVVPATSQTLWSFSAIVSTIFGFIQMIFGIATAPFNFMAMIQAPLVAKVLVGGTYIVMNIIAVVQLISGRAA